MFVDFIKSLSRIICVNPIRVFKAIKGVPVYVKNLIHYYNLTTNSSKFSIQFKYLFPVYGDRYMDAGRATGHYFHQDLWAAKRIFLNNPALHIDIGSRVDGFISHLLVFRPVTVIDVRLLTTSVEGLTFKQGDVTKLDFSDNSLESISSLHAIEHIGLGRYGDDVDHAGWEKSLLEIQRVLKPGGTFYLGVPIGYERLCFDAHRVFNVSTIIKAVPKMKLVDFSYVDDDGDYYELGLELNKVPEMQYGCGLFEFKKL